MQPPPLDLAARLLYRDALMLVIDKPAGLPVHRGPDNARAREEGREGVSLETYLDQLRFGLPRAPALAHRLDRDTSGCLVLGRHRKALERLGDLFKRGDVEKTYWALVEGGPEEDEGFIDAPLGRRDASRGWWMKVDPTGQPASTLWRVLGRGSGPDGVPVALLALAPLTGRTHQLRVHCQSQGWPILGDPIYGDGARAAPSLQLHARSVRVPLYRDKPPVMVTAPVPERMAPFVAACGLSADAGGPEPGWAETPGTAGVRGTGSSAPDAAEPMRGPADPRSIRKPSRWQG